MSSDHLGAGSLPVLQDAGLDGGQSVAEQNLGAVAELTPVPGLLLLGHPLSAEEVAEDLGGAAFAVVAEFYPDVVIATDSAHLNIDLLENH